MKKKYGNESSQESCWLQCTTEHDHRQLEWAEWMTARARLASHRTVWQCIMWNSWNMQPDAGSLAIMFLIKLSWFVLLTAKIDARPHHNEVFPIKSCHFSTRICLFLLVSKFRIWTCSLTHCSAGPHQDLSHFQPGLQGVLLVGCREGGTMLEVFEESFQDPLWVGISQSCQTWREFTLKFICCRDWQLSQLDQCE